MKTSKLFSLVIAFVILSSTVFAGNPETKDSSIDSSEELYVNPLEEVLAMQSIPEIILDDQTTHKFWANGRSEEENLNPLSEVLAMEAIPVIALESNQMTLDSELFTDEFSNPLQDVLEMEAIPAIDQTTDNYSETFDFDVSDESNSNPLQDVLEMDAIPAVILVSETNLITLK